MAARRFLWAALMLAGAFLALTFLLAVWLAEISLHPARLHQPGETLAIASGIAQTYGAPVRKVNIKGNDGTGLNAWWLSPRHPTDRVVFVCHGVGDSSFGSLGFAPLFLKHGYSVLVPDSRGHGESLGFVTYGVLESGDMEKWVKWVKRQGSHSVFGLGESLGAAILIQSLARGVDFQAIVAESSYSSFTEVADERVSRVLPVPLAWLLVREAIFYVRIRYGVKLWNARPDVAIVRAQVPVLLIHGQADNETNPENSVRLARANPSITTLWLVPGAKHTGAYFADPKGFEKRVLGRF